MRVLSVLMVSLACVLLAAAFTALIGVVFNS